MYANQGTTLRHILMVGVHHFAEGAPWWAQHELVHRTPIQWSCIASQSRVCENYHILYTLRLEFNHIFSQHKRLSVYYCQVMVSEHCIN